MKQSTKKKAFSVFAATTALFSGFVLWQKFCLWRANQTYADPPHEIYSGNHGTLAYSSKGHGRPLLLLHSMFPGTSRKEWNGVIDLLAEQYHVYALDLPGFGSSEKEDQPWTAYQYAQCLQDFTENVITRPYCILAANGGADLALVLAMLYPEKLRGLILVSPEGLGQGFATNVDTQNMKRLRLPLAGTQLFLTATSKYYMKQILEDLFFAKEKIPKEMPKEFSLSARRGNHAQAAYAAIETGFWRADTKGAFASLTLPFLMIWGEENKENSILHMDWAEEAQPDGDFVIFESTGAFPHLENSQAFVNTVKKFLK